MKTVITTGIACGWAALLLAGFTPWAAVPAAVWAGCLAYAYKNRTR